MCAVQTVRLRQKVGPQTLGRAKRLGRRCKLDHGTREPKFSQGRKTTSPACGTDGEPVGLLLPLWQEAVAGGIPPSSGMH